MVDFEAQAAAATATLAQLTKDWQARPDVQLARAQERAGVMGNDTVGRVAADREIARLQREVEKGAVPVPILGPGGTTAEPVYLTDAQRIDFALEGRIDHLGANVTAGSQVPLGDFNGAVGDLVMHGAEPEAVKSFLATGQIANGEDRETQIEAAERWRQKLLRDPEMQAKLFSGDPELKRQFDKFGMYAAAPHEM